ncbi:hypothetical protein DV738_g1900, partial [Chaetothyriales sp. CBS 135597]
MQKKSQHPADSYSGTGKDKELFNPFRNDPMAYQLEESLDDFFSRLRPSTATTEDGGPWIWIANPHANHWPASADIASFKQEASSLLEADMTDVERILLEMKNINLPVRGSDGRGIYYKCDAYSYLDIFSGNEFGLRASLYCSRDFEGGVRRRGR